MAAALLSHEDARAADVPAWMSEAASATLPAFGPDVSAWVLLAERTVSVDDGGSLVSRERRVVRILTASGRDYAQARTVYASDTAKVKDMRAWLVRPGETEARKYGRKEVVDATLSPDDLYNEARLAFLALGEEAVAGSLFGAEWVVKEDRPLFLELDWPFQNRLPVRRSRLVLEAPRGWTARSETFNHPQVAASRTERAFTWELTDLPPIAAEPWSPPLTRLAPRLVVAFEPPEGTQAPAPRFRTWNDVARWVWQLAEPQANTDTSLTSRAREVSAGIGTKRGRAAAVGRAVQDLRYVSVQTGIGRGGGYRPHPAIDVLSKGYGDCKDKANLLRTLLAAVDVPAWVVIVYSGDRDYVSEAWPSPQQFNHAIVAVSVEGETADAAAVDHPELGRLLFFDPTDPDTPFGELPSTLQGSRGLLVRRFDGAAAAAARLVILPRPPAGRNRLHADVRAVLADGGAMSGTLVERASGSVASGFREERRTTTQSDYAGGVGRWLAASSPGTQATGVEFQDGDDGSVTIRIGFASPRSGQQAPGLLLLRPTLAPWRSIPVLTAATRTLPVSIPDAEESAEIRLEIPAAWAVDELPEPVSTARSWGSLTSSASLDGAAVVLRRKVRLSRATIVPADYTDAKTFFEEVRRSSAAPIVLRRKG